jgi:hypothetical protein
LAFREISLRVRLLANILGAAPHPRSESGIHRVSFLTVAKRFAKNADDVSKKKVKKPTAFADSLASQSSHLKANEWGKKTARNG